MPYGPAVADVVGLVVLVGLVDGLVDGLVVLVGLVDGLAVLVELAELDGETVGPSAAMTGDTVVTMARALSTATGVRIPLSYQTISGSPRIR